MPKPFSDDLRWRIIYQRLFYVKIYKEITSQLFVSPRTVLMTVRTFLHTGDVKTCRIGRPTGSTVLIDCFPRMHQVQLHELANLIFNATGPSFCLATLCRVVFRLGITRKKVSVYTRCIKKKFTIGKFSLN